MSLGQPNRQASDGPAASVLVVGAGPVGLGLAAELALQGVDSVVVDKRDGSIPVPKMSQVSARNMEYCRRWGIAKQVKDASWIPTHPLDFVYVTDLIGQELARLKVQSYVARGVLDHTPEGACHCPQTYFDPILLDYVKSLPGVTIRHQTELLSFAQDGAGVDARLRDLNSGKEESFRARYMVGCDGAKSMVREALGIELEGLGVIAKSVNVFFRSAELPKIHDKGWARFFRLIDEQGCWSELLSIDGKELWRLHVFQVPTDDSNGGDFDADAALVKCAGTDFSYEVLNILHWDRRDSVAEKYHDGRVFLAGDAAHQCSPTGGLGMHAGLIEAVNLAWKLAAQLAGWGGPGLLDSYGVECRPAARCNVDCSTRHFNELLALPGMAGIRSAAPGGEAEQRDYVEALPQLSEFSGVRISEKIKSFFFYEGSPICLGNGSGLPAVALEDLGPSARPGAPAPHAWIGEDRSTLDLFSDAFTLLRMGDEPDDEGCGNFRAAAAERGVPLQVVEIDDPAIRQLYERKYVLVRPDAYVAWWGDRLPSEPMSVIDHLRGAG